MGSCASTPKVNNSVKTIIAYKNNNTTSDKNPVETYHGINNNHNNSNSFTSTRNKLKEISTKSTIKLRIEPDIEEYLLPIYLTKDETIAVHIQGLWSFIPEYGLTDFKGHPGTSCNNMQIGQALYRIQGGSMHPFLNDRSIIQAELDGQLVFYSNNDQSLMPSQAQGCLDITLEGVCMLRYAHLSLIQEWNKVLRPLVIPQYLTNDEGELVDLINRVRVNPKKFANQYIDIQNKSNETKETYDFLSNYTAIPSLEMSPELSLASKEHAEAIGRLGVTGHTSSINDVAIKQRIEQHTKRPISYYGENILYGKRMPWSIMVDMVIGFGLRNSNNRMNILNESYDKVGLCIAKHWSFKWVCVIIFGKDIE